MYVTRIVHVFCLLTSHLIAVHGSSLDALPAIYFANTIDVRVSTVAVSRNVTSHPVDSRLSARQDENGGSCDRRARCKRNKIRNPYDPSKCVRCPPLLKPDPTRTICIKDGDSSKEEKKNQLKERIKEKIKEMMKEKTRQFKETLKERLEKLKEPLKTLWDEKKKSRDSNRNQKRFRRMAACSPVVATAIGTAAMLEMADGGFSEDLFDSANGDMLELWPGSDIDEEWLDKLPDDESDLAKEDYVKQFLDVGDAVQGNTKRYVNLNVTSTINGTSTRNSTSSLNVTSPANPEDTNLTVHTENIVSNIVNAFKSLARLIVAVARARAASGTVPRVTKYFSEGRTPNLKQPGGSKFARAEQQAKAKEIAQNKNWSKCLRGDKPEK